MNQPRRFARPWLFKIITSRIFTYRANFVLKFQERYPRNNNALECEEHRCVSPEWLTREITRHSHGHPVCHLYKAVFQGLYTAPRLWPNYVSSTPEKHMDLETGIVGGVFMAHAPQFFTLPRRKTKIRSTGEISSHENRRQLEALKPDVAIVIANDHANQFLLHCVPASHFTAARAQQDILRNRFLCSTSTARHRHTFSATCRKKNSTPRSQARQTGLRFRYPVDVSRHRPPSYPTIRKRMRTAATADRTLLPSRPGQALAGPASPGQACRRGGQRRAVPFSGNRPLCQPSDEIRPQTNARTRHRESPLASRWTTECWIRRANIELRCWLSPRHAG